MVTCGGGRGICERGRGWQAWGKGPRRGGRGREEWEELHGCYPLGDLWPKREWGGCQSWPLPGLWMGRVVGLQDGREKYLFSTRRRHWTHLALLKGLYRNSERRLGWAGAASEIGREPWQAETLVDCSPSGKPSARRGLGLGSTCPVTRQCPG